MHEWDTVVSALISGNFRFMLVLVSAQTTIQLFPETQQCCQSCKRGQSQIWGVRKWAASDGQLCLALFHSLITLDGARFCCNIYGERGKKRKSTLDQMSFKLQKSGRQNKKHKSQMSCMISLRQITPSASLLSNRFSLRRFLSTQKKMTDSVGLQSLKNPSMDFRVLLLAPHPCPRFHSLPLPNQFHAGTLLTQVKGLWSSSQCLCLLGGGREGWRHGKALMHPPH